ncbi:hypothetical protein D3C85_1717780 [compost metagenome]
MVNTTRLGVVPGSRQDLQALSTVTSGFSCNDGQVAVSVSLTGEPPPPLAVLPLAVTVSVPPFWLLVKLAT